MDFPLRSLPQSDRPRERMLEHGPGSISVGELIAIILGSGMKGKSVLQLANEILSYFGSLEALSRATIEELQQIKGMGPAKAIQLLSAITLGKRLTNVATEERPTISSAKHAYDVVRDKLEHEKREIFMILLLDVKNQLIAQEIVSVGTLCRTLVHPREVFYPAIRHKAAGVVLVHNHPSGDPTPSDEDVFLTDLLVKAGKMMFIPVHEHIVVGKNSFRVVGDEKKEAKKVA
jgi:DNA repair protein RadC